MTFENPPIAKTQMLIRKPCKDVFFAFVDPEITTKFWFTKSNGKVEAGKKLSWEWEMYGVSIPVKVKEVELNKRILIEWGESPSTVEWIFTPRSDESTLVCITNSGFNGNDNEVIAQAIDSMGGFTSLLASAKAFLEHGIQLNLVADHHPDAHI